MSLYYVLAGSNIDPEANIVLTAHLLDSLFEITAFSNVYRSPPINGRKDNAYLNCIFVLDSELQYDHLKDKLKGIETTLGRVRTEDKFAARTIDLDIVFDGKTAAKELTERLFAAQCFFETAGDVHVGGGKAVSEIIGDLRGTSQTIELDKSVTDKIKRKE